LARFDGNLEAAGEAKLDIDELLSAFPKAGEDAAKGRQDAITCFLSASEGWEQAKGALKGTFAAALRPSWLKQSKE
jgi:hypothetical protein